jgi:hypothetical protein
MFVMKRLRCRFGVGRLYPKSENNQPETEMKKIIEGKKYDTDTATMIASAESSCNRSDFGWWEEDLYRTPRGRYFVAGSGGPMSKYSRSIDANNWSGGEGMEVLTDAEALAWCERHSVDADVIAEHFQIEDA